VETLRNATRDAIPLAMSRSPSTASFDQIDEYGTGRRKKGNCVNLISALRQTKPDKIAGCGNKNRAHAADEVSIKSNGELIMETTSPH